MTVPNAEMSAAAEPAIWGNVPRQNKNFTGRVEILARLRRGWSSRITAVLPERDRNGPLPQAVQGLGGVGKTAIAIEYAHLGWALRHLGEYQAALDVLQTARENPGTLAPEHLASLRSANCYTIVCRRIPGRREEALQIARNIYRLSRRLFTDSHPDTLAIEISLSNLLRRRGDARAHCLGQTIR
jgi:hypothetical protein